MLREWVAMAVAIGATGTVQAQEPPAKHEPPASPLDDLIAKSRQVRSFTATFTLKSADEPGPETIRCDYNASSGCRVVIAHSEGTISLWCVDRVLTIRVAPTNADNSSERSHARVDLRELDAPMDAVFAALNRDFGEPRELGKPPGKEPRRSTVTMNWAFEAASDQGEFKIMAGELSDEASPFGWLETLREKRAEPTVDGDSLRFSTDGGQCKVVVAKEDGFLREFVGRSANKTLRVNLETVILNPAGGMPELDPPQDPGDGEDLSPAWHSNFERDYFVNTRNHTYEVITKAAGDEPWSDDLRGKMRRTLRPLDDWGLHSWIEPWIEPWIVETRRWLSDFVAWLGVVKDRGVDPSKVADAIENSKAKLIDSLASTKSRSLEALVVPKDSRFPDRAARLLEIEREVMEQSFDSTVRDPLIAEFTKATADAQK